MFLQDVLQLGHRGGPTRFGMPDAASDLRRRNPGCGRAVEDRVETVMVVGREGGRGRGVERSVWGRGVRQVEGKKRDGDRN